MDDGEQVDPFNGTSDEYMKKREGELQKRSKKRMSARARQVNKVGGCS